jgi:malonyl-CoA/methylmalonyl-CoA synthetase
MTDPALPLVGDHPDRADHPALTVAGRHLTHGRLAELVAVATRSLRPLAGTGAVVAVPALARTETAVALLGALRAGVPAVPLNPGAGPDELAHVVADCRPALVATATDVVLPDAVRGIERLDVAGEPGPPDHDHHPDHRHDRHHDHPGPAGPDAALVVYTSGTTGPPKGVVLSHQALVHDLDALARAWRLDAHDVLVHALPLFHVHGLVLGLLGPLRLGASVRHLGRFDARTTALEFDRGATVLFGVPTMYHRLADAVADDPHLARALGRARLLVSGSAGLPAHDRTRITAATGRPVLERYGMTETLITCAMTVDGAGAPGTVGPPLPGVELRLVTDDGTPIEPTDHDAVGEIEVRGATLFSGYLGRPDATAACFTPDGWFRTGDLATWADAGTVRIAGRRSVDLIKTGGYRVGAGEVENALLSHPDVAEVAVTAEPDPDLGERIVAWVVPVPGQAPTARALVDHVARHLTPHKRPRDVRFVTGLPRNELGKVRKRDLRSEGGADPVGTD